MKNFQFIFLLCCVVALSSCLEGENTFMTSSSLDDYVYECEWTPAPLGGDAYLTEEEMLIVDGCVENEFQTSEEILDNLIGEWELTALANNWVTIDQPCIYLWIEDNGTAVIHYSSEDQESVYRTDWTFDEDTKRLEFESFLLPLVRFEVFCEEYLITTQGCDDCFVLVFDKQM